MPLTRVWYERGQRGKLCFIMPVIRYPWIRSLLTITGVTSMCHKWKNRSDGSDDVQLLLDLATKDENSIELWSGDMSITLTVCPPVEFKIRDEAEMNAATRLIDFGTSIFYGLDEIEKLRIEDRQAGT